MNLLHFLCQIRYKSIFILGLIIYICSNGMYYFFMSQISIIIFVKKTRRFRLKMSIIIYQREEDEGITNGSSHDIYG